MIGNKIKLEDYDLIIRRFYKNVKVEFEVETTCDRLNFYVPIMKKTIIENKNISFTLIFKKGDKLRIVPFHKGMYINNNELYY